MGFLFVSLVKWPIPVNGLSRVSVLHCHALKKTTVVEMSTIKELLLNFSKTTAL